MDFSALKTKALELKNIAQKKGVQLIEMGAQTLSSSAFTITQTKEFEKLIKASQETTFHNKQTGEVKHYCHRSIIIFADEKSDFFKHALYIFPVLVTKAFSQNIPLKLGVASLLKKEDKKKYAITDFPCMLVFENEKWYKTISGNENITKLVKSFDLDINKGIDSL